MTTYSHSRLSLFEQCPLKYKFKYIDKLEPEIKQTIEGFLGNIVHSTLEWIYTEVKLRAIDLDEIIKYYAETWHESYNSEIKVVKEENNPEYYFNKGIKFLVDYFVKNSPFKDNTIETEKKILFNLDNQGKYKLIGYIDRLVHNTDTNIFEIHDYKTSSTLKTQEELDKDRQLAIYSLAIKQEYPYAKDVHLIWHFLDFNQTIKSKRTLEELEDLRKKIISLIEQIESTKEFNPNLTALCNWCEFQSYCKDFNDKCKNSSNEKINSRQQTL